MRLISAATHKHSVELGITVDLEAISRQSPKPAGFQKTGGNGWGSSECAQMPGQGDAVLPVRLGGVEAVLHARSISRSQGGIQLVQNLAGQPGRLLPRQGRRINGAWRHGRERSLCHHGPQVYRGRVGRRLARCARGRVGQNRYH